MHAPLRSKRERWVQQLPSLDGHFEVLQTLGSGSFGTASLVREVSSGQERVIKAIRKGSSSVHAGALVQEVEVLKAMDHPHIIRIFLHYEDYRFVYIVMEPAEGGELLEVVREIHEEHRIALNESWAAQVFHQCLSAIAYCHARGILHKDLKNQNIMLLSKDRVSKPHAVVIDFGVAELVFPRRGRWSRGHLPAGTCTTMAPEVWRGDFGPKCDVWSLGCVLFEFLGGRLPFMARSPEDGAEWCRLHEAGPDWGLLANVGQDAQELCRRMLLLDERVRPTAQNCLRHHWLVRPPQTLLDSGALKALCALRQQSRLERAVCTRVVASLNSSHVESLTEVFRAFDVDSNGLLSAAELVSALRSVGVEEAMAQEVMQLLDASGQGVEYTSFLAATLSACDELFDDLLWRQFTEIDTDGSGYLSKAELEKVISGLGLGAHVDTSLAALDTSGDGRISFEEFLAHFRHRTGVDGRSGAKQRAAYDAAGQPLAGAPQQSSSRGFQEARSLNGADYEDLLRELERRSPSIRESAASRGSHLLSEAEEFISAFEGNAAAESVPEEDDELDPNLGSSASLDPVPEDIAEVFFRGMDLDAGGGMSPQQFERWAAEVLGSPLLDPESVDAKVFSFQRADVNRDGVMDQSELRRLLGAVAEVAGPTVLRQLAATWARRRESKVSADAGRDVLGAPAASDTAQEVDALLAELNL